MEIERLKQEITNCVMEKILKDMSPMKKKYETGKKLDKPSVFSAFDDDEKEDIKKNKKKLFKASTERGFIKKRFTKRWSKGKIITGNTNTAIPEETEKN